MEKLEISKENALTAYKGANEKGKKLLSNLFGEKVFQEKITDRIKTFDDVLEANGIKTQDWVFEKHGLSKDEKAYREIKLIVKTLNEGWEPDWSTTSQTKYYPWFKYVSAASRFSFCGYFFERSFSRLGSRLVYKSEELAVYAGKTFEDIYNTYLNK